MLVPHIALRYEVKIRSHGALSTTTRKRFGRIQEDNGESSAPDVITVDDEDEESEFLRVRKRDWARLIQKVWKDTPEIFPECGSRCDRVPVAVAKEKKVSVPGSAPFHVSALADRVEVLLPANVDPSTADRR